MGLQLHRTLWFLALLSSVAIYIVYKAAAFTGDALSPQGCRMSWMFPEYILQSQFNSSWTPLAKRYSLWLYREGDGWDTHRKLTGVPVLFIPGNAGSSHQVRSIASSAARQYFSARGGVVAPEFYARSQKPLDFFATEFNEDFSALHGPTLTSQTTYVHAAIAYILSQYPSGTRIFIIGHSMGGIVAASVLPSPFVSGIITLSTPYALPPARYSSDLEQFYKRIHDRLRDADLMTPIISICGGATDLMIPSETCYLPSSTDAKNQKTIYTTSMEGCWTGTSHQVSVWCHQVRWRVARSILELEPEESELASFTTLSKWIRDQSDALELSSVMRHEAPADIQWVGIRDGQNLIVEKSTQGTRGYLIPIGPAQDSFTLLLTGGKIASIGPFNTPDVDVQIFWCSNVTTTPSCLSVTSGKVFLMPNPRFARTFPAAGEGVDESDGVAVVEIDSVTPPPLHTHIGVHLTVRETSPMTSLIAGFEQQQRIESHVSLTSLLWRSHSVDIVAGYMRAYVTFNRLANSPLLVYRIKPVLSGNCKEAMLAPTISHTTPNEQQYYLASENSLLLHSNVGGPFLRSSSNSLQISLLSSGSCSVTQLGVSLDLYSSIGRCGVRYFGAVVAWAMGLSGLILANGCKHWRREGVFPSVTSSALSFVSTHLVILTLILFLASLLGLPPEFLLGNRGDASFAILSPLVLWIACGCVCFSVIALEFCLWFWGKVLGAVWTLSSGESRGPRWSILHIAVITGATLTLIPYQVIFVICFVMQFFTTATTAKAEPSERSIQKSSSTSARHQNTHVLLVLFWLLPNMAPSLAVWIRTIATTGSITLFNSDHSPLPVLPFLTFVEIANARPEGALVRKNRPFVLEWATKVILITASAVPLALGARYPFFAFNAGAVIFVCLLVHCCIRLDSPQIPALMALHAHLLPPSWKSEVGLWLSEDTPSFDYGGFVVGEDERQAIIWGKGKTPAVLAGVPFVDEIFKQLECSSHRFKHIAEGNGFKGVIAGTRKTTPGFRLVEKYGMMVGGIDPHRYDLSSMIMLKDNHIWSAGSISSAVSKARSVGGFSLLLDVEVSSEEEANEAIEAGANVIMLDNMAGETLVSVARKLREKWKGKRSFLLETSGGIEEGNLVEHAINEIDILSTSAVHQSVQHIDFSLKIQMSK